MHPSAANPDPDIALLDELTACAGACARSFSAEMATATGEAKKDLFELFDRSFRAVRLALALKMKLRRAPPALAHAPQRRDHDIEAFDELDRLEGFDDLDPPDRDRETESESVSFPAFLKTLGLVARDAAALGERLPESLRTQTLPTLVGLLDRAAAVAPASARTDRRAQLAAGTSAVALKTRPHEPDLTAESAPARISVRRCPPDTG